MDAAYRIPRGNDNNRQMETFYGAICFQAFCRTCILRSSLWPHVQRTSALPGPRDRIAAIFFLQCKIIFPSGPTGLLLQVFQSKFPGIYAQKSCTFRCRIENRI